MLRIRRRGRWAGCTGVELLAVTGILTTLAGNSGSVFMQVRNKAAQAQCATQLQQIYLSIQMWSDDNDGKLPLAWFFTNQNDPRTIVNVIAGKNQSIRKLFICPAAPEPWKRFGLTYVYNDLIRGKLLDSIPNPSMTWLLMDANVVSPTFPAPHLGGYNVLFCDGHVKWIPQTQIYNYWRPPPIPQPEPVEDEEHG